MALVYSSVFTRRFVNNPLRDSLIGAEFRYTGAIRFNFLKAWPQAVIEEKEDISCSHSLKWNDADCLGATVSKSPLSGKYWTLTVLTS